MTIFRLLWIASAVVVACSPQAPPTERTIVIDGSVADWDADTPLVEAGPAPQDTGLRALRLWVADDDTRLLVRVDLSREIGLQSDNPVVLCLDGDDNAATGSTDVAGADACWRFGERRGTYYAGNDTVPLVHQSLGLVSAPTVTADAFELSLDLAARPAAARPLIQSDTVGITLLTGAGQALRASYVLGSRRQPPVRPIPLDKRDPSHLRLLSYNLNDRLTEPSRRAPLGRIFTALRPDVVLLQEIRSTPIDEAAAYAESLLPPHETPWHAVKLGGERSVVVSPFPILRADSLGESGAVLLDLASRPEGGELLIIVLSAPCCRLHVERQREFDMIMAYLRDAREGEGRFAVAPGTPILLMGDANLVGPGRQLGTLLDGAIDDQATFGPAFLPDWDDTPLTDLVPRHTDGPFGFTWYGDEFPPGRLDYVIYGDSRLEVGNCYVLYTPEMPTAKLAAAGLKREDTDLVSDHLPVVADLVLPSP